MRSLIGTAALALILAGCGGGDETAANGSAGAGGGTMAAIPAPNGDWTQTVSETPEGGFRMGNSDAPVKLVEYGSLGCHVCADFSTEGGEVLTNDYVKTGRVSWEFRPYLLFPTDPGPSMLLRCQGAGPFFALSEQLYADQKSWMGKLQALPPEQIQQIQSMPPQQGVAAFVQASGLDQYFRERGMPQAKIDSCLADPAGLAKLTEITALGNKDGVQGTPTFLINGEVANVANWASLKPKLDAALR